MATRTPNHHKNDYLTSLALLGLIVFMTVIYGAYLAYNHDDTHYLRNLINFIK